MIATRYDDKDGSWSLILRPNVTLSWWQTKLFLWCAAGVCFAIAGVCGLTMGLWTVLPFTVLNVGALVFALIATAQRVYDADVVRISESKVEIEKGRRQPEHHWSFDRVWSEVILAAPGHSWYPTRLVVRSQGELVELGSFLADDERAEAAGELRHRIGPMARLGRSSASALEDGASRRKA